MREDFTAQVETLTACPVCYAPFGDEYEAPDVSKAFEFGGNNRLAYYHCEACGAYALNPRMTDEYTRVYYSRAYRAEVVPVDIVTKLQHISRVGEQMRLVGDLLVGKTLLELGCSSGYFLRELVERGFSVTGVDPDKRIDEDENTRWYRDIADLPPEPFDIIAMSHVMEHFNHPREILEVLVNSYASAGTRVMIDVPNVDGCYPAGLWLPHHPVVWGADGLRWLLEVVGCKVIFEDTHGNGLPAPHNLLMVGEVL